MREFNMQKINLEIEKLENISRILEPALEKRNELSQEALAYADHFLDNMESDPVYCVNFQNLEEDFTISEEPVAAKQIIKLIKTQVDHPGLNPASGRHLAYIPGGGVFPGAIGDYLAAIFNKYAGLYFASPGGVKLENNLLRWMGDLIGYPASSLGNLTSCGSMANLIGIVTARDAKEIISSKVAKSVIYVTPHVHHSVQKALRIAGLSESKLHIVTVDEEYKMRPEDLEIKINNDLSDGLIPFLAIGSVGTTDTGAVDPICEISSICIKYNLWLHVDASYGGFFILCKEGQKIVQDLHLADSVVLDPHKGLFLPYGLGAILVKDGKYLFNSFHYTADYMQDSLRMRDEISPADLSPELTKHFKGLRLWVPLLFYGLHPFRAALEEKILLAIYFYQKIKGISGFEVGPPPQLSVVIYRYIPRKGDANKFNLKLVEEIQNDGRVFISSTKIGGLVFLRLAVLSFRTHKNHIDLCIEVLREMSGQLDN